MLDIFLAVLLAFVAGFVVKIVDWIDDEKEGKYVIKWPLAIVYGILIGYLISQASFSTLFLAALFAQVFALKIDTHTHVLGFAFAMLSLFWFGFPQVDYLLFILFTVLAFLDEIEFVGRFLWLTEHRVVLLAGSAVFITFGRFDYFVGILAFDIGYLLFEWIAQKYMK